MTHTAVIASLFKRLGTVEPVVRIIMSEAPISVLIRLRGRPEKKVFLDFSKTPARIFIDPEIRTANIHVTIDGKTMHHVLLGHKKPGIALGRRELLLRGSGYHLAKLIPLFDFSPVLYGEHLKDIGFNGFARGPAGPPLQEKETAMSEQVFNGDPIELTRLSFFEKAIFKLINMLSFMFGFITGLLRYRLFKNLSLFKMLASLSAGLAAAKPKEKEDNSKRPGTVPMDGKKEADANDEET